MKQYFYAVGQQQMGPVSFEELKNVGLTTDSLVWFDGLADWNKASDLEELNEIFNPTTPVVVEEIQQVPVEEIAKEEVAAPTATTIEDKAVAVKEVAIPVTEYAIEAAVTASLIEPMTTAIFEQLIAQQTPIVEHTPAEQDATKVEQATIIESLEAAPSDAVVEVTPIETAAIAHAAAKNADATKEELIEEIKETIEAIEPVTTVATPAVVPAAAEPVAITPAAVVEEEKRLEEETETVAANIATDHTEEAPKKGFMASIKRFFGR